MGEEDKKEPEKTWASETMRRNMEFIVQQQAQFAAAMQQLRETQARSELKWERTEEGIRALLAIAQLHEQEITASARAQSWLLDSQARAEIQVSRTDERVGALTGVVERLAESQVQIVESQAQIVESQTQIAESQAQLAESQAQLAESQARTDRQMAETDERISALVNVVERLISERRDGLQG